MSEIWGGDGIGCIAFLHSEHEEWRQEGRVRPPLPAPSVHFLAHVGHFAGRADITMTRCAPLWSQPATLSPENPAFGVSDWTTGLGKKAPARFGECEVKNLRFPDYSRQENAIFSPHIHQTWPEPFSEPCTSVQGSANPQTPDSENER